MASGPKGPTGGTATGQPSSDLPTVVVTGPKKGGYWAAYWPAGLLVGGAQIWTIDVGYNGYYEGAMWAISFTKALDEVFLYGLSGVDGALAVWSVVKAPGLWLTMRFIAGAPPITSH